jgi:hypothetical protein
MGLATGSLAKESSHSAPGRPVSGHTLSRLLFPATEDDAEEPTAPVEAPANAAPQQAAATPQQPATTPLRQPGFIAPTGATTAVGAASGAAAPSGAAQASTAGSQASGLAASKSQNQKKPATGWQSLWQTFLGTNNVAQRARGGSTQRPQLPAEHPRPAIASAAPASKSAGKVVESLFGQIAGVPAAKRPATGPRATPSGQQLARRLPAVPASSGVTLTAGEIMDSSPGSSASAVPHYAVTSAPAVIYPPGTIPPPEALEKIPQALADGTRDGGALAGLWRPMITAQNEASLPRPSVRIAAAAAPAAANIAESDMAALMLQPFQLTNGNPAAASGGTPSGAAVASNNAPPNLENTIPESSLIHQLSMTVNGQPYSPAGSVAGSASGSRLLGTEQGVVDGSPASASGILQTAGTTAAGSKKDRELLALMQELAPEPADLNTESVDLEPEPAPEPSAAGAGGDAKKEDTLEGAEKLGTAPEDRTLEFLRTETVLLKPGESQCDVGVNYLFSDNDFPILLTDGMGNIIGVSDVRFLVRELTVPIEYRVGLAKRVQGFISLPVGWSNTQVTVGQLEDFRNDGGLGDLNFGLTIQCNDAEPNCPYVITTISGTAPTGGDPFTGIVGISPSAPSLGDGFWSVQGTVLFIQQYDPVVVFYGLGVQGSFPHEYIGIDFQPGTEYDYLLGVGFAVNERITLSTRFFGSYVEEIEANGQRVIGTNVEPMTIRMSATISKPCKRFVEPFVEFGLNDDSVNSTVGITWTF